MTRSLPDMRFRQTRSRAAAAVIAVVVAALVAACGGGAGSASATRSTGPGGGTTAAGPSPAVTFPAPPPANASARVLFARDCAVCHSLSGHASRRQQGGDLRNFRAPRAEMTQLVAEMPVRKPLTRPQLTRLVDYLMAIERGG